MLNSIRIKRNSSKLKKIFSILGLTVIVPLIYFLLQKYNIEIKCLFNEITGLYCPGCGITRAIDSLLHFDMYQALRYNMVSVILLPFIFIYTQYLLICYGFDIEDKFTRKIPKSILYSIIIIYILFGVLRNIPLFDFLAPTEI